MAIQSRWQPPGGLNRSLPRPVRLSVQGKVFVFLSVLFVGIGASFGWMMANQVQRDQERDDLLRTKGADTTATVIETWQTGGKSRTPMISYRFTADGREIHGQAAMNRGSWRSIYPGNPLAVRYLPANPEVNRPAQAVPGPLPNWMPWTSALAFAWPPLLFWWIVRRESRLLAEGTPAAAVVTKVYRRKKLIVYYDFKLPTGEEMHGKSAISGRDAPQPGEQICILYNPDNPRRNALYPLETVRLAEE